MSERNHPIPQPDQRPSRWLNVRSTHSRRNFAHGKRARGGKRSQSPFLPPEDWHEPRGDGGCGTYNIFVRDPGAGYCHAVTAADVRERLAELPNRWLETLEVVQLSQMTRKKRTLPCYGMQWGSAIYLYPIEDSLIEYFSRPPLAAERRESQMYGGRWEQESGGRWRLIWTPATIRDFYLNNILIHELGHLLDHRNRSFADRERYADWFAIEYGYRFSRRAAPEGQGQRRIKRRHGCRS
jgi:hypothetical protein